MSMVILPFYKKFYYCLIFMIRYLSFISYCLFLLLQIGNAQAQPVSTPAIIKHLLSQKKEIPVITGSFTGTLINGEYLKILPRNKMPRKLWSADQYLVYTPGNLFLGINGTGILYKIISQDDTLNFIRDDSTFFMGNSFCSANFSIGDTIYSYGGYGFWKNNGHIRYYSRVFHEWEVVKANREIISNSCIGGDSSSYIWVDAQKNRFYLAGQKIINDGLMPQQKSPVQRNKKLFVLDINKQEWTELGEFKNYPETSSLNSPWGPLFILTFESYINDFNQNRKLAAKKPAIEKLKKALNAFVSDIAYFVDSTLYFGNSSFNTFDSIQLSLNDFEYRGEPVYTPIIPVPFLAGNKNMLIWLAIISVAISTGFLYYKRKKRKTGRPKAVDADAVHEIETNLMEVVQIIPQKFNGKNGNHTETFSEIEKELILFIYEKTRQEYTVSLEEINKVLGLSGKNESVQKKNRSETINTINQKWSVLHQNNHSLIERQRSEFDKRSFEYFIQPMWLDKVAEMSAVYKSKGK